jgi:diguanylate cyclase (GGDEF)-like protein
VADKDIIAARMRSKKEILLLLLSGILTVLVTPFAYVRLRDEQWTIAALDIGIVCIMLLLFFYVYVSRRTRAAGIVMALAFIAAALTTTLLLGASQIYWAYPALMSAFFLLETRHAVIFSVGFVCSFLAILWVELPALELASISLTLVTTILFAYSFALTNRQQQYRLRREANIDPLTGTGNRRALNKKLDSVNAIFRRSESPGSVLILDVDHFKKINDAHGHIAGDQILVDLADLIRSLSRATETLYRYGGEEFVVIAEHTNEDAAAELAERLRSSIDQKKFSIAAHVTVSIGVAQVQRGEGRQGWLNRADAALFRAKAAGRNRVIVAQTTLNHLSTVVVPGARANSV